MSRGKREILAVALVVAGAVAWSMARGPNATFRGQVVEGASPAPELRLVDQHGQPFDGTRLKGKVSAIFFGYTHCPDVCPATLALFARARAQLAGSGGAEGVQFIFVTVDPERDGPEEVRRYVELFDPAIVGLTGTPEQIRAVTQAWGIAVQKVPLSSQDPGAYTVTHSAAVLLVDRRGRVRVRLPFGASAEDLAHDLRLLAGER